MEIHVKGTHYEPTPELTDRAREKVLALKKFKRYFGKESDLAKAHIELGKESADQKNGPIWLANIDVDIGSEHFHARHVEESLERAIDEAVAELSREVRKLKDKRRSALLKGGSVLKSLLRGFERN